MQTMIAAAKLQLQAAQDCQSQYCDQRQYCCKLQLTLVRIITTRFSNLYSIDVNHRKQANAYLSTQIQLKAALQWGCTTCLAIPNNDNADLEFSAHMPYNTVHAYLADVQFLQSIQTHPGNRLQCTSNDKSRWLAQSGTLCCGGTGRTCVLALLSDWLAGPTVTMCAWYASLVQPQHVPCATQASHGPCVCETAANAMPRACTVTVRR